jgi:predicted nucleic acid-binding protein
VPILLISDANILIDMQCGGLLASIFELSYSFAVPDVLFEEELRDHHPELSSLGLQVLSLQPAAIEYAMVLMNKYAHTGVGRIDLLALALANQEDCPLLTGDRRLRSASEAEGRAVRGTLWLVEELFGAGLVDAASVRAAYEGMKAQGRRLPWGEIEAQLRRLG